MENNNQKIEARIDSIQFSEGKTEVFASVTIGDEFSIHDIHVTDTDGNIDISIPQDVSAVNGEKVSADAAKNIIEAEHAAILQSVDHAYARKLEEQQAQEAVGPNEGMTM